MSVKELRNVVDRALTSGLEARGFRRVKPGVFMVELTPEWHGWVGIPLASAKRSGEVDADPMVGVRCEPIERLVPQSQAHDATAFRPLYELVDDGSYTTWSFDETNVEQRAESLIDVLDSVGRPFIESLATTDAIEQALTTWAFADLRRKRLPALLLARGDAQAAQGEIERQRALLAEEGDSELVREYDSFASALLRTGNAWRPTTTGFGQ